jgi:hypothetical protein
LLFRLALRQLLQKHSNQFTPICLTFADPMMKLSKPWGNAAILRFCCLF